MAKEPTDKKHRQAAYAYKKLVCDRAKDVDPSNEYDWFALSLGFLMGYGLTLDEAHDLSLWIRYTAGDFQDKYKDWVA